MGTGTNKGNSMDTLPRLLPKVSVGPRTEAVCATANKIRTTWCLRPLDHEGKHCNAKGERW